MVHHIKKIIDNIIEETTHFDFPFLASEEKKKTIIQSKKKYIEEKFKIIAPELFFNSVQVEEIWNESVRYADEQFKTLPINKRLNGFYLQELMHHYAEKLGDSITFYD